MADFKEGDFVVDKKWSRICKVFLTGFSFGEASIVLLTKQGTTYSCSPRRLRHATPQELKKITKH